MKIIAVVVTYNRKELLCECMQSILGQTLPPNEIIVVDNSSTDGTNNLFQEDGIFDIELISYQRLEKNIGGAGGFYEGIKQAADKKADWIWIMDDDTIPYPNTLEQLCNNLDLGLGKVSFLASCVYGPDGQPMNEPSVDTNPMENGCANWYCKLSDGLVKIKNATFVSLLINYNAVNEAGLPRWEYFIWGDDIEYTTRLTRNIGPAYLCGNSKVIHKRKNNKALDLRVEDDIGRIHLYYYLYRNTLINLKQYEGKWAVLKYLTRLELLSLSMLFCRVKFGVRKFGVVQKSIFEFFRFQAKF